MCAFGSMKSAATEELCLEVTRFRKAVVSSPTHHGLVINAGVRRGTTKLVCARTHSKRESKSCSSSESKNTPSLECLRSRVAWGYRSQWHYPPIWSRVSVVVVDCYVLRAYLQRPQQIRSRPAQLQKLHLCTVYINNHKWLSWERRICSMLHVSILHNNIQ